MHGFRVSRETSIQGGGLSIHGSRQLFYSSLSDCAAACRAAVDCGAFVHSHGTRPYHCTFKRLGAAVEGMLPSRTKDTYRKTHKSLAKSLRMPMPTHTGTGATLHMHTSVFCVNAFVACILSVPCVRAYVRTCRLRACF